MKPMVIVPPEMLASQTLRALIEEFVTRDGAVHGHTDVPVEQQIATVQRQLRDGTVIIVFDEASESCSILPKEYAKNADVSERRIVVDE